VSEFLRVDRIPEHAACDLLVLGAGTAGCCAAIAAARDSGHSVILIDRYGFPGGTSTQVLDTFYGFFTPGERPKKVVGGIPDSVVDKLDEAGEMFLRPNTYGAGTGVTYNPERLKLVWDDLLSEAGVRVLLHATLVGVDTSSDDRIDGVIIHARGRFLRIRAKRFVDATGDAELCALAGIPFEKAGERDPAQTLTTTFRVANVDLDAYERQGGKRRLNEEMARAIEKGTHPLPRREGSIHAMSIPGCSATVAVRVADIDSTDFEELGEAERTGRRQAFVYERFLRDRVPGYAEARIVGLSHHIGVRESRRVYGEYRLTREDCLTPGRFADRILICGAPIEDHRAAAGDASETHWAYVPGSGTYDVPYGTIVPAGRDDCWVVGRCFSATHDAHASCRSMAQTMSMGQAAGIAAQLSLEENAGTREVSITRLQDRLRKLGAVLEAPGSVARTEAHNWKLNRREQ